MRKKSVDGLVLKAGPTESGIEVGGEIGTVTFIVPYWPLIIVVVFVLGFILYRKRTSLLTRVLRLITLPH